MSLVFDMNSFSVCSPFDMSKTWPKSSSILCYYCNHKFKSQPLSMPEYYDERLKQFTVYGVFCSWGCMKSFNNEKNDSNTVYRCNLIFLLHGLLTKKYTEIKASPPKYALKCYGGKMSIDEFRKYTGETNVNYTMLEPPLVPINPLIDKNINFTWVSNDEATKKYDTFEGTNIEENQLKIKRDPDKNKQTVKSSQNTLEKSMGLLLG